MSLVTCSVRIALTPARTRCCWTAHRLISNSNRVLQKRRAINEWYTLVIDAANQRVRFYILCLGFRTLNRMEHTTKNLQFWCTKIQRLFISYASKHTCNQSNWWQRTSNHLLTGNRARRWTIPRAQSILYKCSSSSANNVSPETLGL